MSTVPVDLLTGQHNYAILRLPQRRFPGVLFQGDSLHILYRDVVGIRQAFDDDPEEARQALLAMETELRNLVLHCVAALRERGLPLPFLDPDLSEDV